MNILICTDGSPAAIQSVRLLQKMGLPGDNKVTVLGVSEDKSDLEKLTASIDQIVNSLQAASSVDRKIRNGLPEEEIMSEASGFPYDLVVVGGGGKQIELLSPQLGPTSSKLARRLHTHFLVVRNVPEVLTKILFCIGPEGAKSRTLELGGEWISNTSAQIRLLHVTPISPIGTPTKQTIARVAGKPPSDGDESEDTILVNSIQQLRYIGIKKDISARIRKGMVVEQVLDELSEGGYQLIVVGAHYQPGHDRWTGTLLDDITDQLLNRSDCSVLII